MTITIRNIENNEISFIKEKIEYDTQIMKFVDFNLQNSYLVFKENTLLGICEFRPWRFNDEEFRMAIFEEWRGKGLAKKIHEQILHLYCQTRPFLRNIHTLINFNNEISRHTLPDSYTFDYGLWEYMEQEGSTIFEPYVCPNPYCKIISNEKEPQMVLTK